MLKNKKAPCCTCYGLESLRESQDPPLTALFGIAHVLQDWSSAAAGHCWYIWTGSGVRLETVTALSFCINRVLRKVWKCRTVYFYVRQLFLKLCCNSAVNFSQGRSATNGGAKWGNTHQPQIIAPPPK